MIDIEKVRTLWERAGTPGEKEAAFAALQRIEKRLAEEAKIKATKEEKEQAEALRAEVGAMIFHIKKTHPHFEFFQQMFKDQQAWKDSVPTKPTTTQWGAPDKPKFGSFGVKQFKQSGPEIIVPGKEPTNVFVDRFVNKYGNNHA